MGRMLPRPRSKAELGRREAAGLWKAIALSKKIGESGEKITLDTILGVHKVMLDSAYPDVAGRFRVTGQDVEKLTCIVPPPGREVLEKMYVFRRELDVKLATIPRHPKRQSRTQRQKWLKDVFSTAAWTQHQIAAIHPFGEGNGRVARLMTNLLLARFGLLPSQVKYESKEDKARYLDALCQIDKHQDYEPLERLIATSVFEVYKKEEQIRKRKQAA